MKYKQIKRKKFTPKQQELLEKLHWLHCYKQGDYEAGEMMSKLIEKAEKFLY